MRLATFDIFDTALMRRCGSPAAVFELVAQQLWPGDLMRQCEYLNLRRQSAMACGADASLLEIYKYAGWSDFPEYSSSEIMDAEISMESRMLTANPIVKSQIESLRKDGWVIKFLSDMYLPSEFLAEVLKREGCLLEGEEVIVSCEWNARKDRGTLYKRVKNRYNPTQWSHFGDNRRSDYVMARKNGVNATLIDYGFTPIERQINRLEKNGRNGWPVSLLTGISRVVRVQQGNGPSAILAADYVAATYIPYVVWLIRQARQNGIKRLHFLSRDGYIMMKIAEALGVNDIELNYLFVSRKALTPAYLKEHSAERFVEIADRKTLVGQTVDSLLAKLQLNRHELKQRYDVDFSYNKILSVEQQNDFIEKIFDNRTLTHELIGQFNDSAKLIESYLRQEGLTDGVKQAMVDIGWLGTSRLMINRILSTDIPTYYVGVRSDVYGRTYGDFCSYFPVGFLDTAITGLIENYFSASPWPSTVGYLQHSDGRIEPEFDGNRAYKETDAVRANVNVCCRMAKELAPYIDSLSDDVLFQWANVSIKSISNLSEPVDLTPLVKSGDFDGSVMVRKLRTCELLNLALTGARYTAFDLGSVYFSVGRRLGKGVWRIHQVTAALRSRIYNRFIIKKKQ